MSVERSELLKQLRIDRDEAPARARGRLLAAGVVVLLLVASGLWFFVGRQAKPVVRTAVARAVSQGPGAGSVLDASGYVTARRQATVSAKITGKVTEVTIEEGMRVKEGEILARLDDTETRAALARRFGSELRLILLRNR
jgi:multidrug efflux pump subunit AcrA (membrane-fusion protein)